MTWEAEARLGGRGDHVVSRARRGTGPPVVLKATLPGATAAERAALRREGRLLDRLRGEGVVELLDVVDQRRRTTLVLGFVPFAVAADEAVADLPGLAEVVERLRRAGVVHTALTPAHVLLTPDGRPVLCGFGAARRLPAYTSRRSRSSSVSRRTTRRASPSFTNTTGGRGTLL